MRLDFPNFHHRPSHWLQLVLTLQVVPQTQVVLFFFLFAVAGGVQVDWLNISAGP